MHRCQLLATLSCTVCAVFWGLWIQTDTVKSAESRNGSKDGSMIKTHKGSENVSGCWDLEKKITEIAAVPCGESGSARMPCRVWREGWTYEQWNKRIFWALLSHPWPGDGLRHSSEASQGKLVWICWCKEDSKIAWSKNSKENLAEANFYGSAAVVLVSLCKRRRGEEKENLYLTVSSGFLLFLVIRSTLVCGESIKD